ncbi:PilZ domain-containing protein [Virgibacillus byunsanensis]|uniref:PilZ domain-containing protein n=1 Tax=Virgibacillus byunsanensis TaxID=570945 RepID=A0ABW3LL18_9BACI
MYFKRNEPYRYAFDNPINGTLSRIEKNEKVTANVLLLDVSNEGAKVSSTNDIQWNKSSKINLVFTLNDTSFHALGEISWIKSYHKSTEMGLHLNTDESYQKNMISVLKDIAKSTRSK